MGILYVCDRCGAQKAPAHKNDIPACWTDEGVVLLCDVCDAEYHEFLRGRPLQPEGSSVRISETGTTNMPFKQQRRV